MDHKDSMKHSLFCFLLVALVLPTLSSGQQPIDNVFIRKRQPGADKVQAEPAQRVARPGSGQGDVLIRVGMEYDELRKKLGQPHGCSVPRIGTYHTIQECLAAIKVEPRTRDIYDRKTAQNEYEFRVLLRPDPRESRLHPKVRVSEFSVILDKPATVLDLAADLPEVLDWCSPHCRLVVRADVTLREAELIAYAARPQPSDLELALFAASGSFTDRDPRFNWLPAVHFVLDDPAERPGRNWLAASIKEMRFNAHDPALPYYRTTELGSLPDLLKK